MYSVCSFSFLKIELSKACDRHKSIFINKGFVGCILINVVNLHPTCTDRHALTQFKECMVSVCMQNAHTTHTPLEKFHIS